MGDAMKVIVGYWQSRWMTAEKQLAEVRIELEETRCEVDALDYQVAEMQNDPVGRSLVEDNQRLREAIITLLDVPARDTKAVEKAWKKARVAVGRLEKELSDGKP